jgi:phosphatidylinositol alpha-1,6-mannosyltransferase
MRQRRDLLFVSAGLELEGGGRSLAARLFATAARDYAAAHDIGWRLMSLRGIDGFEEDPLARSFKDSELRLARAVWAAQLKSRRLACIFDLLGPARMQTFLPISFRSPYLLPLYGIEVWGRLPKSRRRALHDATVRLAISQFTREKALAAPGNEQLGDVDVVPLCLEDRPAAGSVDEALLSHLGHGYLLIVGRMAGSERYKGHDQLIETLAAGLPAALRPSHTGDDRFGVRLVIAGDGDDRARLERLAADRGLAGRVIFTGFLSEATLREVYRRCAVLVMPSAGEGFGLVYLEAMRAGRPCIASRDSAGSEIVVDQLTGRLVDPQSIREIGAAVADLLSAPDRAKRMGEAGRLRFEQTFSSRVFRERLSPHLDRLTA